MASDAIAKGQLIPQESKSLVVIAPKANTQIFPNLSQKEIMKRIVYLQLAIIWSVEDFETRAQALEKGENGLIYERNSFENALVKMIDNHRKEEGINWSTVEYYLNTYCRIK
ncbi:hypothetical protein [Flavobacterium sp.]|uniref:hypothetical protein n=1 Tax=Flavobacterium sp. TaxID=239 RepID=UPI0026118AA8|nr:hypothetical protein [Flavobacterium sp.]MDD2987135.1 hypothetical protein [Flavobacterium sp.]